MSIDAEQFFDAVDGVRDPLDENSAVASGHTVGFNHADHQQPLDLLDGSVDLLISLYAGFVSEHCTRFLRVGGFLLVNPSHGDTAMASIDPRSRRRPVVGGSRDRYEVTSADLDTRLVATRDVEVPVEHLHRTGRGIDYRRSTFAYLFDRVE